MSKPRESSPACVLTDARRGMEAANANVFDRGTETLLSSGLNQLLIEPKHWKKIDAKCPPSNGYVYALQRLGDVSGKDILDFGCGDGYLSIILAKRGASVWAFDISHVSAQVAMKRLVANRTENAVQIVRATAFALPYKGRSFDHVIGLDILHHVWFGMGEVGREIFRVLKPGGTAVFKEPFANSRFLRVARRWFPVKSMSDPKSGERQLRYSDFSIFSKIFDQVCIREFQIFSRLDRVLTSARVMRFLKVADEWLLTNIPWSRRFARLGVVELRRGIAAS